MKDKILELLSQPNYTPLKAPELFEVLQQEDKLAFKTALEDLMKSGEVVLVKSDRLCLPKDADLVVGRIHFRQSGSAILFPEDGTDVISVPSEDTGVAMHGDQVLLRLTPVGKGRPSRKFKMGPRGKAVSASDSERQGRVIRVLRRVHTKITGTLAKERNIFHVIPDDPRLIHNFLIGDPAQSGLPFPPKVGDKVVVVLEEWKQKHLNPQGKITEILGRSHEPRTEHAALFVQYGLVKEFPEPAEEEAKRVSVPVTPQQAAGRLDLRQKPVFTIDPDDARDFDDALHLERLPDGRVQVGIHIADASAYVRPHSALDQEAQRRGNSTYLVGEVVPMLPHTLSSGICSLKEAEDRLTKSVIVTFGTTGEIEKTEFANSVIRSIKRLTYKQAKVFLDEDDFEKIRQMPQPPEHRTGFSGKPLKALSNNEMRCLQSSIRHMWSIARKMRQERMRKGSLDLDMPEAKIYLDSEGYPESIVRIEHDESHQLVEEFMLLANQSVAREFNRQHMACLHRVHEKPDAAKLDDLRDTLATMGIRVGDLSQQKEIAKFLELTKSHPKGVYLRGLFLRSMKQACYRASSDGHYGLSMQDYTHFTSPIRRYADFVVHRVFDAYLFRAANPTAAKEQPLVYNMSALETIAAHISITERNSSDAERQSVKNRLLEYFELETKKSPKTQFDAVVTDVKNHGLFVELTQSMAWGLVHVSTMQSDFYNLSDDGQSLVGRKTQRTYTIGDVIKVEVSKIDRFKRQMDFALAKDKTDGKTLPPMPAAQALRQKNDNRKAQVRRGRDQRRSQHARPSSPAAGTRAPFKKSHRGGRGRGGSTGGASGGRGGSGGPSRP